VVSSSSAIAKPSATAPTKVAAVAGGKKDGDESSDDSDDEAETKTAPTSVVTGKKDEVNKNKRKPENLTEETGG